MNLIATEYHPYFVLVIVIVLFITIYKEYLKPAVAFLIATLLFVITSIITPTEVLEGFSNQSIASIVLLILITAGLRSNFNVEYLLDKGFGRSKTYKGFLASMMTKVALLSAVINNTPVVVMMTPYVFNWGKKNNISPSKLLIPLSYATIIGGMITIIGTSTTLVLNGFLTENKLPPISSLSLLIIGSAVLISCLLFLFFFSNLLLPNRKDVIEKFEANKREYLIEKRLTKDSPLVNKTVLEGGLRNLNGVYLVEIIRDNQIISPVKPNDIIQEKDVLIFAGNTENVVDLTLVNIGTELPTKLTGTEKEGLKVVESVISANSSLIGKSIKESHFRERYDAAVVAIHRNGEKLSGKIGRINLKAGDVLLLYAGKDFNNRVDLYKDLYVISGEEKEINNSNNGYFKLTILSILVVGLLVSQLFSLFISLLIIFSAMVVMKLITLKNVKRDLDINLIVILVLSLSLGEAMIKSGAGELIAQQSLDVMKSQQPIVILAGLMILTTLLTSFVTNVGAISIAFPLALAITESLGLEGAPFFLGIAFSASAAFLTPIGYQTNLIVYGPGGYNFKDFLRIGLPTSIIYLGVTLAVIGYLFKDALIY